MNSGLRVVTLPTSWLSAKRLPGASTPVALARSLNGTSRCDVNLRYGGDAVRRRPQTVLTEPRVALLNRPSDSATQWELKTIRKV